MVRLLLVFFMGFLYFFPSKGFSAWHEDNKLPKEGQLIMKEFTGEAKNYQDRKVRVVYRYNPNDNCPYPRTGWYDVGPGDLWKWIGEDFQLIYVPDLRWGRLLPDHFLEWFGYEPNDRKYQTQR